jgi:hypothetical protein
VRCPNCSAECSDQAFKCGFCDYVFASDIKPAPPSMETVQMSLPPTPPPSSERVGASPPPAAPSSAQSWPPPDQQSTEAWPPQDAYQDPAPAQNAIPNHIVWAILATVIATGAACAGCCFFPLLSLGAGITAIVYASKVDNLAAAGYLREAEQASNNARLWCIVTSVLGVLFIVYFAATLLLGLGTMFLPEVMGVTTP